ncbi:MAG: hypothetical protein R3D70_23140 [Rhizobiaceae bacterium]
MVLHDRFLAGRLSRWTSPFAAIGSGGLVGFTLGLIGGGGSILATTLL